jgi:3',5'-cyclic AMP phosphodiesterase CpdA
MDRRAFLKKTVLGGAAVVLAGCRSLNSSKHDVESPVLHLAFLSDTHIPGDRKSEYRGFNPWENLRLMVPQVIAANPEGVVLSGDAARLEGKVEDYRELRDLLEPIIKKAPVFIGLGNHDDRGNFKSVFEKRPGFHPSVADRHITIIEHEVVRVVILDSLLYTNRTAGFLGRRQRQWLAEYLKGAKDRPIALVVHHTMGAEEGELLDTDHLFSLIRPHNQVKAIFYGHSHVWALSNQEGRQFVNLPATGYSFRAQDPVGWVQARFRREGVELTLHASAGNRGDNGKTTLVKWL